MSKKIKNKQASQQLSKSAKGGSAPVWIYLIPVLILTFLIYSNTLKNYFIINWDDDGYIINNPMIKELSWDSIMYMFSHFHLDNYHPLTTLSHAIEFHLFNLNPLPYHFDNLVLHLINTILVYYFIQLLLKHKEAAVLVALLFAIHPMHVESVAWLSERKDLLYTCFFLLSLIYYHQFIYSVQRKYLIYSILFMLLSCLSKSAAVALTPVLFLLDFYSNKKFTPKSIIPKIPFLILSVLFGVIALYSQGSSGAMNMVQHFSFLDKPFLAFYGLAFYLIKLFAPIHLSSMYLYPVKVNSMLPVEYYLAPLIIIPIVILFRFKQIQKELFFGFLFYFFTLAMVIQVVPVGKAIVADRYSYVPYIGIFFILAKGYILIRNNEMINAQKIKPVAAIVLILYVLLFCISTWNRNKDWKDSYTLFSSVIKLQPDRYFGYFARGLGLSLQNDVQGAINDYTKGIEADPENDVLWYNRGVEMEKINQPDAAIADYSRAVQINPKNAKSFYNRGNLKFGKGNLKDAIKDYTSTIQIDSANAEAYCNRAITYLYLKDSISALNDFNASIRQNPKLVNALYNRASLYISMNKKDEACIDFSAAAKEGNTDAQKMFDYYCKK